MRWKPLIPAIAASLLLAPAVTLAKGQAGEAPRSVVRDGAVTMTVSVDKAVAQVAEPIQLTVEVQAPQGTRVQMPQLPQELGEFDTRNTSLVQDIPAADNPTDRVWRLRSTLETIKTGPLSVPALDVHFAEGEGATKFKTLHARRIHIDIASVLEGRADPSKIRDIKPTINVAVPQVKSHAWLVWAGVSAGALALAIAPVLIAARRRGPAPVAWAIAQIADLEQLHADGAAGAEAIYNELVDVVREFFEYEFDVPTLSRTGREFLTHAAKTVDLPETPRQRLKSLLSIADQVKFARLGLGDKQVLHALEDAKAFVAECDEHRNAMERKAA
ncbi:MAG: hypothetical protein KDA37_01455 [Planctomycetales bacterium]|nr:hypothetical protein [Planctomycetales bacterium]